MDDRLLSSLQQCIRNNKTASYLRSSMHSSTQTNASEMEISEPAIISASQTFASFGKPSQYLDIRFQREILLTNSRRTGIAAWRIRFGGGREVRPLFYRNSWRENLWFPVRCFCLANYLGSFLMTGNIKFDVYRVSANAARAWKAERRRFRSRRHCWRRNGRERLEEKFHGEFGTLKRFSCECRPAKMKFKGQLWMARRRDCEGKIIG